MYLVTGGTGFIGRSVVNKLISEGKKVRVLTRNPKHAGILFGTKVEIFEGDILDPQSIEESLADIQYVIHCAAMVSFWKKEHNKMHEINVIGTANLVNAMLDTSVKKWLYVSSISALGRSVSGQRVDEDTEWKNSPLNSAYAVSKYKGEREALRGLEEGIPMVMVNPGLVIGPGDWDEGTPKMFKMIFKGLPFYLTGTNGFVGLKDVTEAIFALVHSEEYSNGEKFILVSQNLTYKLFFSLAARSLGKKPPVIALGKFWARIIGFFSELISSITGTRPIVSLESTRTASNEFYYNGDKICESIGFVYQPMEEVIQETGKSFLVWKKAEKL